jgi:transcriptional regulator with XRE-family HTH domain
LRIKAELSQEDAAERIGIHPNHLRRLESGSTNPTIATLAAVCEAFSISISALFQSE